MEMDRFVAYLADHPLILVAGGVIAILFVMYKSNLPR